MQQKNVMFSDARTEYYRYRYCRVSHQQCISFGNITCSIAKKRFYDSKIFYEIFSFFLIFRKGKIPVFS